MPIRKHIRSTLMGLDHRLKLRSWLANGDQELAQSKAPDPFSSSTEIKHPKPRTVIDIGGNNGQFAEEVFRAFPDATVYSFEPIPECFERLELLRQTQPSLHAYQIALSSEKGEAEFYLSQFRDSSSLQEMLPSHVEAWPHTGVETSIKVKVDRLDSVASELKLEAPMLAKLDVQGHEMGVIEGGRETLSRCQRIMVECNFAPLYKGQPTFIELYDAMHSLGFLFEGFIAALRHPRTQEQLSADAIFFKPGDEQLHG